MASLRPKVCSQRRKNPKRGVSVMWNYFFRLPDNPTMAVCNICNAKFSSPRTTGTINRHLRSRHPDLYAEAKALEKRKKEENINEKESLLKNEESENSSKEKERTVRSETLQAQGGRQGPKRSSVVWNYFVQILPEKAKCTLCGALISKSKRCTSQLLNHLRSRHKSSYAEAMAEKKLRLELHLDERIQHALDSSCQKFDDFSKSTNCSPVTNMNSLSQMTMSTVSRKIASSEKVKDRVNKSLIKLISVNLLPPSIVEIKEFKEMLKALDSRYELPTKTAVLKTLIPEFAEEVKKKLKADVDSASHFALTVETWTYRHGQRCVTVMAHFIKDSWETSAACLETIDSPEEINGESMIQEIRRITDEWGISDKVVSLVSDHSETLSAVALTMGWEHLFCFGEMLNNIIQTALQSVPEVTKILTKVNEVAEYFDKSIKATEILLSVQQQHNLPENCLKTDVENKWISTYRMMERMSEQFEAANTVLCYHGKADICLCDEDVELMRLIANILKPFEVIVVELLCKEFTSMSKVVPFRNVLQEVIGNSIEDLTEMSASVITFRDCLVQQMETKFGNLEMNSILPLCTLLDPRFKHHAFTDTAAMEMAQDQLLQEMKSIAETESSSAPMETAESERRAASREGSAKDTVVSLLSMWTSFDKRVSEAGAKKSLSSEVENESRRYFKEALISRDQDPLEWWKLNQVQFPHLHVLAKKYLCTPATSVCSSRLFTKKAEKFNCQRNMISPRNLNAMLFLSSNGRVTSPETL